MIESLATMKKKPYNLSGKMLVATPTTDPNSYFSKSVIYIIKHDENGGTIGLIVNQLLSPIQHDLFIKTDIGQNPNSMRLMNIDAYVGGPVDSEKGFLLHMGSGSKTDTKAIQISSSMNLLRNTLSGRGPKHSMFVLGYCGWDQDQLNDEIKNNSWLVLDADKKVIFETENKNKWEAALTSMNINPAFYISKIGRC